MGVLDDEDMEVCEAISSLSQAEPDMCVCPQRRWTCMCCLPRPGHGAASGNFSLLSMAEELRDFSTLAMEKEWCNFSFFAMAKELRNFVVSAMAEDMRNFPCLSWP